MSPRASRGRIGRVLDLLLPIVDRLGVDTDFDFYQDERWQVVEGALHELGHAVELYGGIPSTSSLSNSIGVALSFSSNVGHYDDYEALRRGADTWRLNRRELMTLAIEFNAAEALGLHMDWKRIVIGAVANGNLHGYYNSYGIAYEETPEYYKRTERLAIQQVGALRLGPKATHWGRWLAAWIVTPKRSYLPSRVLPEPATPDDTPADQERA